MKRYNYLYDITADRMNKMMARNWGKLVNIDKEDWTIDELEAFINVAQIAIWVIYYNKTNNEK